MRKCLVFLVLLLVGCGLLVMAQGATIQAVRGFSIVGFGIINETPVESITIVDGDFTIVIKNLDGYTDNSPDVVFFTGKYGIVYRGQEFPNSVGYKNEKYWPDGCLGFAERLLTDGRETYAMVLATKETTPVFEEIFRLADGFYKLFSIDGWQTNKRIELKNSKHLEEFNKLKNLLPKSL